MSRSMTRWVDGKPTIGQRQEGPLPYRGTRDSGCRQRWGRSCVRTKGLYSVVAALLGGL